MSSSAPASGQPPIPNNMGGLNPRQGKQAPAKASLSRYWCGIDQLTLTYSIDWGTDWESDHVHRVKVDRGEAEEPCALLFSSSRHLRAMLDSYQLVAMAKNEPVEIRELPGVVMHPLGGSIGKKRCRFKLEMASCIVLIADQSKYRGDWPNVKLEICGERCLCFPGGAEAAYKAGAAFIESLGGDIHKERVNRVDVCADFPGWGMDGFMSAFYKRHWVCRSKFKLPYDVPTGRSLVWGQSPIMLRIYDKLREQRLKSLRGSPAKFLHMIMKRWGGEEPARAVRVEYQLRRDALKTFGVTDFDSWMENHGDILRYLVGEGATFDRWSKQHGGFVRQHCARWFRFLTKKPDNKHPERNKVSWRWAIVQRVFLERFGEAEPVREIRPEMADLTTLIKQAYGVLKTAACNHGYTIPGKKSAAESKYTFGSYESFEMWFCAQIRSVVAEKGEWNLKHEASLFDVVYDLDEAIPVDVLEMIRMDDERGRQMKLDLVEREVWPVITK